MVRPTFRAAYAKHVLHEQVLSTYNTVYNRNDNTLPQPDQNFLGDKTVTPDYNQAICIVGAGAAGLSAAVMLHFIGFTNITILEASSRIGGRAYTHHFKAGAACSHNYYDVGAMRIPLIDTQLRYAHFTTSQLSLKPSQHPEHDQMAEREWGKSSYSRLYVQCRDGAHLVRVSHRRQHF